MADGAFRLWFRGGVGCWVMWREEMDSRPWAFPLVYSHWFTESTERKEAKKAVFLQTLSWWRWRQSGRVFAALHGVFPPLRSVVNASLKIFLSLGCSTGCCSLQYFHRENTQRISHQSLFFFFPFSFILVYFLIKKWNQLLKGCFEFQKDQWLKWFSLHTLAALCLLTVERLSFNLFFFFFVFPAQLLSFACVYMLPLWNVYCLTITSKLDSCCSLFSRANRCCLLMWHF